VWSSASENIAQKIGADAQDNKIHQLRAARRCAHDYSKLMCVGVALGPLSAVITGIGMTLNPEAPVLFPVVSSIVAFAAGIVTAVARFSSLDEKSVEHKLAAGQYARLEGNIRRQLAMPRPLRQAASKYLRWADKTFDEVFASSPLVEGCAARTAVYVHPDTWDPCTAVHPATHATYATRLHASPELPALTRRLPVTPEQPAPRSLIHDVREVPATPTGPVVGPAPSDLVTLTYTSILVPSWRTPEALQTLITFAAVANQQAQVSGELSLSDDLVLVTQTLEGGASSIYNLFERIRTDPRHTSVRLVRTSHLHQRTYREYGMVLVGDALLRRMSTRGGCNYSPDSLVQPTACRSPGQPGATNSVSSE
jgi:hypothetical protein